KEKPVVVPGLCPMLFVQGSLDLYRNDVHVHGCLLFLRRGQRLEFKRERVFARGPSFIKLEMKSPVVIPDELLIEKLLAIRLENEPAFARIEIKRATHIQFHDDPEVSGIPGTNRV